MCVCVCVHKQNNKASTVQNNSGLRPQLCPYFEAHQNKFCNRVQQLPVVSEMITGHGQPQKCPSPHWRLYEERLSSRTMHSKYDKNRIV